jgi:hypothetical protein
LAVDTGAATANTVITDASIQARLQYDISHGIVAAPDPNRLYIVYVEPNVAVNLGNGQGTTQQGILGYHGAFGGTYNNAGVTIRYAVIAYPGGTEGNSVSPFAPVAMDQLTSVTSHEVAEAVTDPDVNYARLGWYDPQRGEIGDIEENNPAAYVRLADGALVQEVGNQNDQLLSIASSSPPAPPPGTTVGTTTSLRAAAGYYHGYPAVTFTVDVTPASGTAIPGGTVELLVNGQVLGTATVRVVNGRAEASFTVLFYSPGSYTFTAAYLGSSGFSGSTSNAIGVTVS